MRIPPLISTENIDPPDRAPWQYESPLCAEIGTDFYYLEDDEEGRESTHYQEEHSRAITMCKVCPHIAECLSWGTYHEKFGIWGGTTPRQRRTIRQANKITLNTQTYAA